MLISLSSLVVENIIEPIQDDVFTFTVASKQQALVEFIHADILKQWLAVSNIIEQKFNINIKPSIIFVDENETNTTSCHSVTTQSTEPKTNNTTSKTVIILRRNWAMIANHPIFSNEYKDYIRSELNYEIQIHGDRVEIHCFSNSNPSINNDSVLLTNQTEKFMRRFAFRSVVLRQPEEQLNILRTHSAIVAFCCTKGNNYLLATKNSNVQLFMQKLSLKESKEHRRLSTTSTNYRSSKPLNEKQSSPLEIPEPLCNTLSTKDKPIISDETVTECKIVPISTSSQEALFANKKFENYLQIYFNKTYQVQLDIKLTIDNRKQSVTIKVVGRQNDGWVQITDAVQVIQYQLDNVNILCVCEQQTSPISIRIHYIDGTYNELGISEQIIDELCRTKLIQVTCKPIRLDNEWMALKTKVLHCDDYGKNICLFDEQHTVTLYGTLQLVKDVLLQFESLNKKNQITKNISPIIDKIVDDSRKFPTPKPRTLNVENVPQFRETLESKVTQSYSITFDVDEPGFEILINQNSNRLLTVIGSKCSLTKHIIDHRVEIQIPKAKLDEIDNNAYNVQSGENNSVPEEKSNDDSGNSGISWFFSLFHGKKPNTQQQSVSTV
ncbi:unnamed protein product, partial [Adineta steineri]